MTAIYTDFPTAINIYEPEVEAVVALTRGERDNLKVLIRFCREIERSRHSSDHARRRAARMRHSASGALALLRAGGRS